MKYLHENWKYILKEKIPKPVCFSFLYDRNPVYLIYNLVLAPYVCIPYFYKFYEHDSF